MARFWYGQGILGVGNGSIDLDAGDLKLLIVMTNTTCDTEFDVTTLAAFTTLDEPTPGAGGYDRRELPNQTLTYTTVPGRRVEAESGAVVSIVNASDIVATYPRSIQGYVIFFDGSPGDDSQAVPLVFNDTSSDLPLVPGVDFVAGDNVRFTFPGAVWSHLLSKPAPA